MEDRLVTISQLVEYLPYDEGSIRPMLSRGTFPIPSYKMGGKRVFKMSDIQEYIENLEEEEPEEQAKSLGRMR